MCCDISIYIKQHGLLGHLAEISMHVFETTDNMYLMGNPQ